MGEGACACRGEDIDLCLELSGQSVEECQLSDLGSKLSYFFYFLSCFVFFFFRVKAEKKKPVVSVLPIPALNCYPCQKRKKKIA